MRRWSPWSDKHASFLGTLILVLYPFLSNMESAKYDAYLAYARHKTVPAYEDAENYKQRSSKQANFRTLAAPYGFKKVINAAKTVSKYIM